MVKSSICHPSLIHLGSQFLFSNLKGAISIVDWRRFAMVMLGFIVDLIGMR